MKSINLQNHPDVIMIYQDKEDVTLALQQILALDIKFKAYKYDPKNINKIAEMKPKVLLLSSNNVKNTIQYYINFLEEYKQNIAAHSAILLINNRETSRAYLACENGLFDNYVIINPLNEPYRLKLILLQELQLIESHKHTSLEQLVSAGEDELASCIEHGVALKKSFLHEIKKCEAGILLAADKAVDNKDAKKVLQNLIGFTLEEMNENVSGNIENIIEQLIDLKTNKDVIKHGVDKFHNPKNKTIVGVNPELLTADDEKGATRKTARYKVLIAEPSNLFTRVIEEIFSETVFKYLLVNDGQVALSKITTFKPDVILLAYDLPTINGLDITKSIREEGNNVPVIAYIHHRDKAVIKSWVPLGLSGYLIKPSKKSMILKSVTEAVQNPIEVIPHNKAASRSEIAWVAEYSVGNKEIDEQHKVLFTIINDFFQQESKQAAIMTFKNLSSYIDLHFETEENLLRQINYPDTEDHIKKHAELRNKFHLLEEKLTDYHRLDIKR
ncbi:hemerythrin domain-containing protein [Colwellia hornerae]|uniref:Response regulator n=1 Tax=Colwellia hornerae TaxID=89402 RepID=A0A5C6Q312_9GAMM|nr:hemerythrin domain-containing protein [Colwellia hornerae]TWX46552.1 response regulator [Colwellia hornerae]TWX54300.1 response regulator [Colwellia hornerae]TWX63077.1 response regulator [Colwellia hornerae]